MPGPLTEQESQQFLAEPRVGVVSVAADEGRPPLAVPVWHHYEPGGLLTFFTSTQGRRARKVRLIEAAGVVTFTVQHPEPPYKYVMVEGTIVDADRSPAEEDVVAIVRRYLPEEMARRFAAAELGRENREFVLYRVRPDRFVSFDFGD